MQHLFFCRTNPAYANSEAIAVKDEFVKAMSHIKLKEEEMKITRDRIGLVIEYQDIIRRYCNFTESEAIRDFKQFMSLRGIEM